MKKVLMQVGALALLTAVFQGCGGDDDDTGSNGAKGGGAGTKSSGGTAGKGGSSSGGKAAQGGSSGGGHLDGGKGGTGHGGSAGRGGGSPGGAGQGGAGDGGGGGGNDNVIPSNPECHCIALVPEDPHPEFSCTTTLMFAEDVAPDGTEICDVQDTTNGPTRASCDNGGYVYGWQVGSENDYVVQRDAQGDIVYFQAFGYVTDCGVPDKYHVGTITAGARVGDCNTEEPCAPCRSSTNGEGGAAGASGASGSGGASGNGGAGAGGTGNEIPRCPST